MEQTVYPRRRLNAARIKYRVGQGLAYLRPRRASQIDEHLRALLRPSEFGLLCGLSTADKAHHVNVYNRLVRHGVNDPNVLTAALLHDVGKNDGQMRVGLVHRTAAVVVASVAPNAVRRMADRDGRSWRRGFWLIVAHPERGALMAEAAGCSERVCWLIAHHHDSSQNDEGLALLQRADEGAL